MVLIILVAIIQCATYTTSTSLIDQGAWPKSRGIAIRMKHFHGSSSILSVCFIEPDLSEEALMDRGAEGFYDDTSDLRGRISRLSDFYDLRFDAETRAKTILQFEVESQTYLYDRVDGLLLFEQ